MDIKGMHTDALKNELVSLYGSIYKTECFSTKDLFNFELVASELEGRGVKVEIEPTLQFSENDTEDAEETECLS